MREVMRAVASSLRTASLPRQFEKEWQAAVYLVVTGLIGLAVMMAFLAVIGWMNGGEIF